MYHKDSREQHGTGRRAHWPVDHFKGGFGDEMIQEKPGANGRPRAYDYDGPLERGIGHGKRYIGAADHFGGAASPRHSQDLAPGSHGHLKDIDFQEGGLERGIGQGRRYIGDKDHFDGAANPYSEEHDRGQGGGRQCYASAPGAVDHMVSAGVSRGWDESAQYGGARRHLNQRGHMVGEGVSSGQIGAEGGHDAGLKRHYSENQRSGMYDNQPGAGRSAGMHHFGAQDTQYDETGNFKSTQHGRTHFELGGGDDFRDAVRPSQTATDNYLFPQNSQGPLPVGYGRKHMQAECARDHVQDVNVVDEYDETQQIGALGHGRKYIGAEDHMLDAGTSAPIPAPHGHGRRHIIAEDHHVTEEAISGPCSLLAPQGRKHNTPEDHFQTTLWKKPDVAPAPPTTSDMKDAVREWLVVNHDMVIFSEQKWNDVEVIPRGNHWYIQALTEKRQSISREGPSAKLIAEKLSQCAISELRHFGTRHRGRDEPVPGDRRQKGRMMEHNPTLVSPGMHQALGGERMAAHHWMSASTRSHDQQMRRYLESGKDNWEQTVPKHPDPPGTHGHSKDVDFHEGIERGIGHGKRYIGTNDSLFGGVAKEKQRPGTAPSEPVYPHGLAPNEAYQADGLAREIGHGRRYLGNQTVARAHMVQSGVAQEEAPGMYGHNRDDDFQDGIERGMGHGRRHDVP